ncbi:MAG: protein kinase [Litorilinea sp.]
MNQEIKNQEESTQVETDGTPVGAAKSPRIATAADTDATAIGDHSPADNEAAQNADLNDVETAGFDFGAGLSGHHLGHYLLREKLGGGVVSAVYRARDETTGAPVAIKTLLAGADDVMRERFRREAELVSSLDHAHIVKTLAVGEAQSATGLNGAADSVAYIAMELAEGLSLGQLLERHGRISASDAAAILAPIAQALEYAHNQEIVHRDVKPSNILLRREEGNPPGSVRISALEYAITPLLTDFGIARAMDAPELTNAGRTIGTPAFMSPEQCAGAEELDGRSDIYGLGAVLYRCVVGKTPYSGSTTQMLYAHVFEPLLIPDDMVALLPPIALAALQQSMMKDPAHRYQSAAAMAADLTVASGRVGTDHDAPAGSHTVTMPALPTVRREGQGNITSRVLVPVNPSTAPTHPSPAPERSRPPGPSRVPGGSRTTVKLETATPRQPEPRRMAIPARRNLIRRATRGQTVATLVAAFLLIVLGTSALAYMVWPQSLDFLPGMNAGMTDGSTEQDDILPAAALPGVSGDDGTPEPDRDNNSTTADSGSATPTTGTPQSEPAAGDADAANGDMPAPDDSAAPAGSSGEDPTEGSDNESDDDANPIPPVIPLETAWATAQDAYTAEDWTDARDWLLIVRRIDADHAPAQVGEMLQMAYVQLAQAAFDEQELARALEWLVRAARELPDSELTERLNTAYAAYQAAGAPGTADDGPNDTEDATEEGATVDESADETPDAPSPPGNPRATVEELRAALADVADAIIAGTFSRATGDTVAASNTTAAGDTDADSDGDPASSDDENSEDAAAQPAIFDACTAALYGSVAVALGTDDSDSPQSAAARESPWLQELVEACNALRGVTPPATPTGRLLYSSQEGDTYRIYAMSVATPGTSALLVDGAAQPRLGINGRMIAFHSWQNDTRGLSGLDLSTGQNPASRSVQFGNFAEDSRDSPPSWSPNGDALAFSSTRFNDGRHRIYITSAADDQEARELRLGKDPAWHPWLDLLVFNGVDDAGQNPGLWLIRSDGTELRQLTDNGNDLRPVWTPDGSAIVFMSSGRHGNTELYRFDLQTGAITRLTYNDAQDGLPAVSPDGRYVAFASDRAGFWEFWYVPLAGGDLLWLGTMNGQLVNWLEHGLQWVP